MDKTEELRWKWAKDVATVLDALAGRTDQESGKQATMRIAGHLGELGEYINRRAVKGSPICKRMVKQLLEVEDAR